MPAAIPIAASVAGAVVSSKLNKSGGGSTSTASNEPWGPAAGLLEGYLDQNKQLNGYYQQNPFNRQQQTGYQNLLGGYDNFAQHVQPGLLSLANDFIGTGYQRQGGSGSGLAGGNPYARAPAGAASQGIPQGMAAAPFQAAPYTAYGAIDWNAQNPWRNELKPAPAPAQSPTGNQGGQQSFEEWLRLNNPAAYQEMDSNRRYGQGGE
jgi:hypothetical protein